MSLSKILYLGEPQIYAVVLGRHLYFIEGKKAILDG
jgi:hypothetical protein